MSVEIVARAKSGFLGIGASPAVVRVEYEAPDEPVKSAEPAAESVKSAPRRPKAESAPAPAAKSESAAPKYAGEGVKADTERFLTGLLERMGITAEIDIRDARTAACWWSSPARAWAPSSAAGARRWTPSST